MDDKSMYVISSDRGQIPGQLQFSYRRRYSREIGIISDAIHEWANLIAAVGLNRYADSFQYSHAGFICCLAWARVTKLIEKMIADEILKSYFNYFRDCEVLSHIPFDSEMFQNQYDSDIACFENKYRIEGVETDNRLDTAAALAKRLTWYYEIPKDNRLSEHVDFVGLYERMRHQKILRELGADEEL